MAYPLLSPYHTVSLYTYMCDFIYSSEKRALSYADLYETYKQLTEFSLYLCRVHSLTNALLLI